MIAEAIMRRFGWEAAWIPDAGGPARIRTKSPVYVGTWTGPDADLLCVRRCATSEEAEANLSPEGRGILRAVLLSAWRRYGMP